MNLDIQLDHFKTPSNISNILSWIFHLWRKNVFFWVDSVVLCRSISDIFDVFTNVCDKTIIPELHCCVSATC